MNNTFKCNSESTQHWLQIDISIFFFSDTNLWPSQVLEGGQVSGTRQNPPTFDRNPWRRPTPESCKSKIEIMTTKKRLRFVRDSLTEGALSVLEGTRSLVLVLVQLVQDQSFNLGFQLYRASANLRDFCVATQEGRSFTAAEPRYHLRKKKSHIFPASLCATSTLTNYLQVFKWDALKKSNNGTFCIRFFNRLECIFQQCPARVGFGQSRSEK